MIVGTFWPFWQFVNYTILSGTYGRRIPGPPQHVGDIGAKRRIPSSRRRRDGLDLTPSTKPKCEIAAAGSPRRAASTLARSCPESAASLKPIPLAAKHSARDRFCELGRLAHRRLIAPPSSQRNDHIDGAAKRERRLANRHELKGALHRCVCSSSRDHCDPSRASRDQQNRACPDNVVSD